MQSVSVFLDVAKVADFQWKSADVNRTQGVCHVIHTFFGSSLGKLYNCAMFHHCRICVTHFREGGLFASPPHPPALHPWAAPKKPILNRVKGCLLPHLNFWKQLIYRLLNYRSFLKPTRHISVQNQQWKHLNKVWLALKINKNISVMTLDMQKLNSSHWRRLAVFIVNFEYIFQTLVSWFYC